MVCGQLLLMLILILLQSVKKKYLKMYDNIQIKEKSEIKITTDEICLILKKEPGPFLKEVFDKIESDIILNKIKNDNNELKKYVETNFNDIIII